MSVRGPVLLLAALSLRAQPTFRSTTSVVEATAIVRDAQGRAVGNLAAADFQLFDNGKPQVITGFHVEKLTTRTPELPTSHARTTPPAATPPSNAPPNHFVAFVFDDQNLVPEHFPIAMQAALRYVTELRAGDRAAIVSTSGRMALEFTGDQEKLRRAISEMGSLGRRETFDVSRLNGEITCRITYLKADWIVGGDSASMRNCVPNAAMPEPVRAITPRAGPSMATATTGEYHQIWLENQVRSFAQQIVMAGDRDAHQYFNALSSLIASMSRMPGERAILLLSPGMYIPPRFRALQDQIIAEAVRARVVISGVDSRGVHIRNDQDDPSTWTDPWGIAETNSRIGFMENVASGTGGRFIRGDNDIVGALRRLDAAPEFLYILGFSPDQLKLDGQYHTLKVALTHARGFTVDARRGYYAANAREDTEAQVRQRVRDAFFSGQERHDLEVGLQVRSSQKPNASAVLTATARIDLHGVVFLKEDAGNRCDLQLLVGLFDQDGNFVADQWKDIGMHPADDALAALRESAVEVKTDFEVVPGRYFVRLLVSDAAGNAMGTEKMRVEIRP
jgi:VWFA-related protein